MSNRELCGWNLDTEMTLTLDFIRSKGLMSEYEEWMENLADEEMIENEDTEDDNGY